MKERRLALEPPVGELVVLDAGLVNRAVAASREAPRKRMIAPLHQSDADSLHRMLNALQPGTYVRPHRHSSPPKAESWIVLQGSVLFLRFTEDGAVRDALVIAAGTEHFGVDLAAGQYHSLIALEADSVLFEVKPGPYTPSSDKEFAPWSPAEGSAEAVLYLEELLRLHSPS